ncbi:MAG: trypsin-like serine protease [Chloroflexi bacterium]|nr:trypsin-like serine protease [Chloroflexota bacterium]
MLQLDATVVGGNSGGPVFDRHGAVVGIISWGFVSSELNFAVSSVHIAALISAAGVT